MGSIAEAPKPSATKYVHVGIHTESVATIARRTTKGMNPNTPHSLYRKNTSVSIMFHTGGVFLLLPQQDTYHNFTFGYFWLMRLGHDVRHRRI